MSTSSTPVASGAAAASSGVAIALMLLGVLLFSLNDVMGKWLVGTYSPAQVLLIRSVAALLILLPLLGRSGLVEAVRVDRPKLHTSRALFSTLDVICFYTALIYLPLADVMAFYMAAPIFVAAMSPFLLGERVGWRRWTAIAVGFVGVLIALNPSAESLDMPSLLSLAGSFFFALLLLTTRMLGATTGEKVMILWPISSALLLGIIVAPFVWVPLAYRDVLLMGLLGVVSMGGYFCVNRSLKLAPAASVAPYQYTLIVWAILFGYPIFGDVPTVPMLVGSAVIVAAGLYIFWREQALAKRQSDPGSS